MDGSTRATQLVDTSARMHRDTPGCGSTVDRSIPPRAAGSASTDRIPLPNLRDCGRLSIAAHAAGADARCGPSKAFKSGPRRRETRFSRPLSGIFFGAAAGQA